MKRFFDSTFRSFFIITGSLTALAALNAFWPEWAVETVVKIAYKPDYTIILQHWGIMVGLMGVFMIYAAFRTAGRTPILLFSAIEKAFMVYLVLANVGQPYAAGSYFGAMMDAAVVLYTAGYFYQRRRQQDR